MRVTINLPELPETARISNELLEAILCRVAHTLGRNDVKVSLPAAVAGEVHVLVEAVN